MNWIVRILARLVRPVVEEAAREPLRRAYRKIAEGQKGLADPETERRRALRRQQLERPNEENGK